MPSYIRNIDELCSLPESAIMLPDEAALYLQMSREALAVRRSKGQQPEYLKHGRVVRYRKQALDSFMSAYTSASMPLEQGKAEQVAVNG